MCNKEAGEKGDGMGWENVGHVMGLEEVGWLIVPAVGFPGGRKWYGR
jgi:hypothetical protein